MNPWSVRRPYKVGLVLSLVLVGLVAALQILRKEETLEEAARNCIASLESGDTRRLFRYFREDEIAIVDLNYRKLDSLLNEFVRPRLRSFVPQDAPQIQIGAMGVRIERMYTHRDGRHVRVALHLTETPRGPRLLYGTFDIALAGLRTYPVEEVVKKWGNDIILPYRLFQALPDLERLALTKLALPEEGENDKLTALTWREFANEQRSEWEEREKRKWPFE